MTIKPIRNDDDLKKVFRRLEKIFQAEEGTAQADERDVLVALVEAYENTHYDFGPADAVEAIKFGIGYSRAETSALAKSPDFARWSGSVPRTGDTCGYTS